MDMTKVGAGFTLGGLSLWNELHRKSILMSLLFSAAPVHSRNGVDSAYLFDLHLLAYCASSYVVLANAANSEVLCVFDCALSAADVSFDELLIPSVDHHLHSVKFIINEHSTPLPYLVVGFPDSRVLLLNIESTQFSFNLVKSSVFTLPGEKSPISVTSLCSSSLDVFLFAATSLTSIFLFDSNTEAVSSCYTSTSDLIESSLLFYPSPTSSPLLAIGITSGDVLIFSTSSFSLLHRLKGHVSSPSVLAFYNSYLATGGSEGSIRVYSFSNSSYHVDTILSPFKKPVVGLSFFPSSSPMLTALSVEGTLALYKLHPHLPWELDLFPPSKEEDPSLLVSMAITKGLPLRVFSVFREGGMSHVEVDVESKIVKDCFFNGGHLGPVTSLDWSRDYPMLLSGGADHSVRLWAVTKNSNRMFEFSRPLIHGHVIKKVFLIQSRPSES
ncbi:hypothetical protein GEMRC1_012982 [Eukaryota sp. GEM-RC1]